MTVRSLLALAVGLAAGVASAVTPNQFKDVPSDSAAIQAAVDFAAPRGEPVTIPAWNERTGTNLWVISETVRLPSGSTVYLDNCRLELAPKVFCNVFSNSKAWTSDRNEAAAEEHDIRIIGLGHAVLDGGEYNGYGEHAIQGVGHNLSHEEVGRLLPKPLVNNCFVYMHNVRAFEVRGLHLRHQRYWGMCYSFCSDGQIRDIRIEADISYVHPDGKHDPNRMPGNYNELWVKNGDGIDIRNGCSDILIENINGWSEDDTVALTNLAGGEKRDIVEGKSTDIHHITIRNVRAGCWKWMNLVRLLCNDGRRIHDVIIDTVVDIRPPNCNWGMASAVQLNDQLDEYVRERMPVMGEFYNILVRNVFSRGHVAVRMFNPMENVTIENVFLSEKGRTAVLAQGRTELKNVVVRNVHAAPGSEIRSLFDFYNVSGELKVSGVYVDSADYLERLADCDLKIDYEDVNISTLKKGRTLTIKKGEPDCRATWY